MSLYESIGSIDQGPTDGDILPDYTGVNAPHFGFVPVAQVSVYLKTDALVYEGEIPEGQSLANRFWTPPEPREDTTASEDIRQLRK